MGRAVKVHRRLGRKRASAHRTMAETALGSLGTSITPISMEISFLPPCLDIAPGLYSCQQHFRGKVDNTRAAPRSGSLVLCGQPMRDNQVWFGKPSVSTSHQALMSQRRLLYDVSMSRLGMGYHVNMPAADLVSQVFVRPGSVMPTEMGPENWAPFPGHPGPSPPPRGFAGTPNYLFEGAVRKLCQGLS